MARRQHCREEIRSQYGEIKWRRKICGLALRRRFYEFERLQRLESLNKFVKFFD